MSKQQDGGISKMKLALGAASLFLFLVGVKRSYRDENGSEFLSNDEPSHPDHSANAAVPVEQRLRNAS